MAKFYAVKEGLVPGIYNSWPETHEQVKGYSGAIYKSFSTLEEAQFFITGDTEPQKEEIHSLDNAEETIDEMQDSSTVEIYVDGSYSPEPPIYGSGWVAVKGKDILSRRSFSGNNARYIESRQVPGEVFACIEAINWAKKNGFETVIISYDYEGIEKWATGKWSAKKNVSKDYVTLYKQASQGIKVIFKQVKAHSGVNFNEVADKLAKSALLKRGVRTNGDGGITLLGIDNDELEMVFDLIRAENPNFELKENTERKGCINYTLLSEEDRVVINYYDTGKTSVQGKDSTFMQYTLTLLIQLCEDEDDVIETLNAFNKVEVDHKEVEMRFNEVLPNYRHTSNKLDKTLKQAAYNLTIDGVRYDYTDLPMPILRAIDYYLHSIFRSIGLSTVTSSGKNNFAFFDRDENGIHCIQNAHAKKFRNDKQVEYVNKIYNFYYINRHQLFHWDGNSEETRLISSIGEARVVIKEGFTILDECYLLF